MPVNSRFGAGSCLSVGCGDGGMQHPMVQSEGFLCGYYREISCAYQGTPYDARFEGQKTGMEVFPCLYRQKEAVIAATGPERRELMAASLDGKLLRLTKM